MYHISGDDMRSFEIMNILVSFFIFIISLFVLIRYKGKFKKNKVYVLGILVALLYFIYMEVTRYYIYSYDPIVNEWTGLFNMLKQHSVIAYGYLGLTIVSLCYFCYMLKELRYRYDH